MLITCLLLLLETAIAADILLNSEWEKVPICSSQILSSMTITRKKIIIGFHVIDLLYQDLPDDPTGRFHDFKEFVKSNFDIFKWIGIWIISAQVILFVLSNTVICNHKINNTLIFNHKLKYISLSTSS